MSYKECMFVFVHSAQEEGWQLEGDTIAMYTNFTFKQREQEGIISPSKRIVKTRRARRLEVEDLMTGIRNEDHQIELEGTAFWIDDLEIKDVFEDEDEKEGVGVIDLINELVEILRL